SVALRALGRLKEAAQLMQASLKMSIANESWKDAAKSASHLSGLFLTLGNLSQARAFAQQRVELADLSGEEFQQITKRKPLADALYHSCSTEEAEAAFCEAEATQSPQRPEFPLFYSA